MNISKTPKKHLFREEKKHLRRMLWSINSNKKKKFSRKKTLSLNYLQDDNYR